jgi:phage shock protein PspC (stress-responsive transcriptional regulator)
MVAGVASGLALHMDVDPIWVRLAFVVTAFLGGLGFLLYIVAWVVMPPIDSPPPYGTMPPPSLRRLYRLRNDRWVAGVAAGLGAHLDVDPNLVRLGFFLLTIFGGFGIVLYIVLWVLMPVADTMPPAGTHPGGRGAGTDLRILAGAFFLIAAVLVLAGNFDFHDSGLIWGAALIGIGLLFLVGDSWPARQPAGPPPPGPPESAAAGGFPPVSPGSGTTAFSGPSPNPLEAAQPAPSASTYTPPASTVPLYRSYTPYPRYSSPYAGPAYEAYPAPAWSGGAGRSPGIRLGTLGLAAVALALGVLFLLQSAGAFHLTMASGFGIVFVVLGAILVLGARFGRAPGLIVLGIILLPFAAAAVLVPEPLSGGAGQVRVAPQTISALQPAYRLAAGQLTVDLSDVDLEGGSVAVTSSVALGQLVVVVPADTAVDVTAKVGAGETSVLGRIDSGVQFSSRVDTTTGVEPSGTLTLNLSVGCGQITVETGGPDVQTDATGARSMTLSAALDPARGER